MITKINTGYILVGVVPWKEYAYDFLFQCSALPYGHMTYGEPILYDERAMCGNILIAPVSLHYHRAAPVMCWSCFTEYLAAFLYYQTSSGGWLSSKQTKTLSNQIR